jgi:hypothetical protein
MDDTKSRMSCYPYSMLHEMRGGHGLYPPNMPHLGMKLKRPSEAASGEAAFSCTLSVVSNYFVLCQWE